ncbi:hypothetical protein HPP92_014311 [Vanilla planifolia]|uniref:Cytochrome P450 n=1 Tax=Vanilla planifolia TaxID=51239 RepID=A0A835UW36_VANPL|nr:hypothetical protein HPP92_014311 [Vanilla planifolia]
MFTNKPQTVLLSIRMALSLAIASSLLLILLATAIVSIFWLWPSFARARLRRSGFDGPRPSFPWGNLMEMSKKVDGHCLSNTIGHSIHSTVFPYFASWRKSFGKVFIYWLGTEPFLYVADPEFLKKVAIGPLGKKWGKPNVFKHDRKPMFGKGLIMVEGDSWTHHRHIIAPAFSMTNLNVMIGMMLESTTNMLDDWSRQVASGRPEIDVEEGIIRNAAEIIAKTSFGINQENGKLVFEKLQTMQKMLFKTHRFVGVPLGRMLSPRQSYEAWKLGREIDDLLIAIINSRRENPGKQDLLGLLLAGNEEKAENERRLTSRDLVDECKTFFFGGHETTGLAVTWTLLLLALHPEWQTALRTEVAEVSDGQPLTSDMLSKLTKMGWVLQEVLRLYSPAPNVQRQAREDVVVDDVVVPKGTNMWIDVVGMHHDRELWGDDADEFRPERFKESLTGGCKHRMGFLPFGFGGRICIGRNLTTMEYKIVLSLVLRRFSVSVSPTYVHSPRIMLSLRPSMGVQLLLHPLLDH